MFKDMKPPLAIAICVVFALTLGGIYLFERAGLDTTTPMVFGTGILAALGIGNGIGNVVAGQQQIKENTNGNLSAQLDTIRALAAIVASSQPTQQTQALAALLAGPAHPEPAVPVSGPPAG